jgi:hypothetical protein
LDGKHYCLHVGFTDEDIKADAFWQRLAAPQPSSMTGGGTFVGLLREFAAKPQPERRSADMAEMREARAAVGRVWLSEMQAAGRAPSPDFLDRYPELRPILAVAEQGARSSHTQMLMAGSPVTYDALPSSVARRQVQSYYCGPASFQMIDGGGDGTYQTQAHWAGQLGTTTNGTAITSIVSKINSQTAWDNHGGSYATVSVAGWNTDTYWSQVTSRIGYYGAPVLEHPILHNDYHSYLSTSGGYGGHFQVGRGYHVDSTGDRFVRIFEPYNEPDWTGCDQCESTEAHRRSRTDCDPHRVQQQRSKSLDRESLFRARRSADHGA